MLGALNRIGVVDAQIYIVSPTGSVITSTIQLPTYLNVGDLVQFNYYNSTSLFTPVGGAYGTVDKIVGFGGFSSSTYSVIYSVKLVTGDLVAIKAPKSNEYDPSIPAPISTTQYASIIPAGPQLEARLAQLQTMLDEMKVKLTAAQNRLASLQEQARALGIVI